MDLMLSDDNELTMDTLSGLQELQGSLDLAGWSVLLAQGPDAGLFLHGQLTQDIVGMRADQARLAGYCSPKGRLLASFVIWRTGDEEFALACSSDLASSVLRRLSMFVLRSKCRLVDAGQTVRLRGWAGSQSSALLGSFAPQEPWGVARHGSGQIIRLTDVQGIPRFLTAGPPEDPPPESPRLSVDAWQWLEACSGIPRIVASTGDQFVPQMINWEAVGGVHFQKGCYPGQEVVARSQYRGTIKRRGHLFDLQAAAQPGDLLFASGDPDQPAGMVVLAGAHPSQEGRWSVFAEVKTSALSGDIHLHTSEGPRLAPCPLPYALPSEA